MDNSTVAERVAAGATAAADFIYGAGGADALETAAAGAAAAVDPVFVAEDSSASRLKSFIERIERLEEEKAATANDIKEVYAEAKGTGFEVKVLRQIVRLRKLEQADRREQWELLDLYMRALGMEV